MEKQSNGDLGPQYMVAVVANLLSFIYGMAIGWTAPVQPLIQESIDGIGENLTESGQVPFSVTKEEMTWVGGIVCIGGVLGTPIFGYCANAIGRKKALMAAAGIFLAGFTLIASATSVMFLLVARFVVGVAGAGTCVIVPMYVGETAEDKIRGVLGSMFNLFICAGILASYIIGSYVGSDERTKYLVLAGSMIAGTIIFLLLTIWLPETPVYSLIKDRPDDAFHSLIRLRGNHKELVERQVNAITSSVKEMTSGNGGSMGIIDMLRDRATRKGLIIANVILIVQQASGIAPIINYTVAIFNASGNSEISGAMAAIIVGALQIVGAIFGTLLMDRAGRKLLLLISSIGMAVTLAPIAYFFHLMKVGADKETLEMIGWLPVTSLSVYIIVFALGFGAVPFILIAELFKTEARSGAMSVSVIIVWGTSFIFLKFFGTVSDAVGIDVCFGIFALSCVGGAIFTFFYVIETKGKSVDEIVWELEGHGSLSNKRSSSIPFKDHIHMEEKPSPL